MYYELRPVIRLAGRLRSFKFAPGKFSRLLTIKFNPIEFSPASAGMTRKWDTPLRDFCL